MAPRIGVYDSGIGGLTTLALLQTKMPSCEFVYFADTARMPFGSKSREEIFEAAENALKILRACTDAVVFGCNTASVTVRPDGAFKLVPDISSVGPDETLVLATPLTIAGLNAAERGFMCAHTPELAVLTEVQASLRYKSRTRLDFCELEEYLSSRLSPFVGKTKKVLLGCSHYIYVRRQVANILGVTDCRDGNDALTDSVRDAVLPRSLPCFFIGNVPLPKTSFIFTGRDESAKYAWILTRLHSEYVPEIFRKKC